MIQGVIASPPPGPGTSGTQRPSVRQRLVTPPVLANCMCQVPPDCRWGALQFRDFPACGALPFAGGTMFPSPFKPEFG